MVPLEPAQRRAYFAGFWTSVGFRYFAYTTLLALITLALRAHLTEGEGWFVWVPLGLSALLSPFVVPFVAGFLGAFFWRHITWNKKTKRKTSAMWLNVGLGLPFHLLCLGGCLLATIPLDYVCYSGGIECGTRFWNSRRSRQFLGDFSTRDDEAES